MQYTEIMDIHIIYSIKETNILKLILKSKRKMKDDRVPEDSKTRKEKREESGMG